jgi:hypothetical protein
MTLWRTITALLLGILLIGVPAAGMLALPIASSPGDSDEEDGATTELVTDAALSLHARRSIDRVTTDRPRSAVVPPHRHHAILVRPQAAPVTFRAAANSPLHC